MSAVVSSVLGKESVKNACSMANFKVVSECCKDRIEAVYNSFWPHRWTGELYDGYLREAFFSIPAFGKVRPISPTKFQLFQQIGAYWCAVCCCGSTYTWAVKSLLEERGLCSNRFITTVKQLWRVSGNFSQKAAAKCIYIENVCPFRRRNAFRINNENRFFQNRNVGWNTAVNSCSTMLADLSWKNLVGCIEIWGVFTVSSIRIEVRTESRSGVHSSLAMVWWCGG